MKRYLQILFIAIILVVLLNSGEAAQKKKKKRAGNKRPNETSPELYCNSCQAIVREALKKINQSRKEYDVIDALTNICSRNMNVYEFPPPEMRKGCEAFMNGNTELLEKELMNRANNEEIEEEICTKRTKACEGIDLSNRKSQPQFVNVNGKEMPIGADGSIKMEEL